MDYVAQGRRTLPLDTNLGTRNLLFSYLIHVTLLALARAWLSPCLGTTERWTPSEVRSYVGNSFREFPIYDLAYLGHLGAWISQVSNTHLRSANDKNNHQVQCHLFKSLALTSSHESLFTQSVPLSPWPLSLVPRTHCILVVPQVDCDILAFGQNLLL